MPGAHARTSTRPRPYLYACGPRAAAFRLLESLRRCRRASALRTVSGRGRRASAPRRVSGRGRRASASRLVSGGVGGPRPLGGSQPQYSAWAETRPADSLRKLPRSRPRPAPPRSSHSRAARRFSPSGNAFLRVASSARRRGKAAGRKKVGRAADKESGSARPFQLRAWPYGAEGAGCPREGPAEACVPSPGIPGLTRVC